MKIFPFQCTTLQYISTLGVCCTSLKEIIEILSPIRADSVEGANGLKVSGDCRDEHEFDWFSHLHCGEGKKGDSLLQINKRVHTLPATLYPFKNPKTYCNSLPLHTFDAMTTDRS